MSLPTYGVAIANALQNGYRVDAENGVIYGLKGAPLAIKLHGKQRYPTVPLVVVSMPKRYYVVPAHKVVGYAVWGEAAFAPGVHVRHGTEGVLSIKASNLSLGSSSDNEMDKSAASRSRVGRIARDAQGERGPAVKVSDVQWEQVFASLDYGPTGRVKRGVVTRWATEFNVSKTCISAGIRNYIGRKNHE